LLAQEREAVVKPADIDAATSAFPARVKHLMPPRDQIPEEFTHLGNNPFVRIVNTWFFQGLDGAKFTPKKCIDQSKALRHLSAVMRSFEPKHEHKVEAVAYLMSLWFERVEAAGKVAP
jgi:hypothetical protein